MRGERETGEKREQEEKNDLASVVAEIIPIGATFNSN